MRVIKVIRVLQVVGGMNQGGTENFLMNLYRNIDRSKIQFDFLVNRKGIFDEEIKSLGGKIYYIPSLQTVGPIVYKRNLDKFFMEHKNEYKIVHSHINQVSGLILERVNKANIPIRIAHSHSNHFLKGFFVRIYKTYLGKKIKKNANYKFACSEDAGKYMFGKDSEFIIINNFIDTNKFIFNEKIRQKVRKKFDINEDCFVIGNVGRLDDVKNPIFTLKIFVEFLKLEKNSKLLMIGKGKLKDTITKFIYDNNISDKVIMLEDRSDINDLMQAMDFFVLPSKYEGLGIVLIEAQASGLRCLTSKDVVPIEAKVSDLLTYYPLKQAPKEWAKFILKNRNYIRKNMYTVIEKSGFDINKNIKMLEEFYKNCIKD